MNAWRKLPPERLAELARALAALRWSWSVAEVDTVLAGLGWTVAAGPSEAGLVARTDLPAADGLAEIGFDVGGTTVTEILVLLTDAADERYPGATDFRRDAFADAARLLTAELGQPFERRPGPPRPEIRWAVTSGVARLSDDGVFVSLALLSREYADRLAAERDLEDDDGDGL